MLHVCLVVGDFNVDFNRDGSLKDMLCSFMSGLNLFACDLLYSIGYTYERDDGHVRTWIDHILCTQSYSDLVYGAHTLRSGCNLSDHHPLIFVLTVWLPLVLLLLPLSHAQSPMVFARVGCCLRLFILMICCVSCHYLVWDVIGVGCLLVFFVMRMILYC